MTKQKNNAVLRWNALLIQAVKATNMRPPAVARAIAMVHTAMYDAWAHYDSKAIPVYLSVPDVLRKNEERIIFTLADKQKAISFAAYRVLYDLFPKKGQDLEQETLFTALMKEYEYNIKNEVTYDDTTPIELLTPERIGNTVAEVLLEAFHKDGSNQMHNYANISNYEPVNNGIDPIKDINHWQPIIVDKTKTPPLVQPFLYPHWFLVKPFAINIKELLPDSPIKYPQKLPITNDQDPQPSADALKKATEFEANCKKVIEYSAALDDETKMIAEYWAAGANTSTPPGMWCNIAQYVSIRDNHDLTTDIKLFFVLGNTLLDSSIACWNAKLCFDYCRPISAIRTLFANTASEEKIWHTPYEPKGIVSLSKWQPYIPTPPFAEHTSGHSTFSAASAAVLAIIKGNNFLGMKVTLPAGSSMIEPGLTPAREITLQWKFFSEAAEQAGLSRLIGGIHFPAANTEGLKMGRKIAEIVYAKAKRYWEGKIEQKDC